MKVTVRSMTSRRGNWSFLAATLAALLTSACAHRPVAKEGGEDLAAPLPDRTASAASSGTSRNATGSDTASRPTDAPVSGQTRRLASRASEDPARSPASNPADFTEFNGEYKLAGSKGNPARCDDSLNVSTEFAQEDQGISRVRMTGNYILDVGSGSAQPSSWGPNPGCDYFTDDELMDNYDTLTEKGLTIQPTDPQWEINRSYSKRCGRSAIPTFSGFDTWYFTPHGQSGGPEIIRHTIFGNEYQCLYQKS